MSVRERKLAVSSDTGMSLVELIVYIALAILVTLGISTMFISGVSANTSTNDRNTATGQAQLISNSLQVGIRNASDFTVTGNLLRARVATGTSGWQCEAWAITPTRSFVHRTSSAAIPVPGGFAGWAVLADDVRGTLTGGQAFAMSSTRLEARLKITVGDTVVPLTTDAVAQAKGDGSPATCW